MDRQPVLEGETLVLRPLREDDREALYAIASDPLMWEQHPAHDRWQRPVFDALFDDGMNWGGALAITRKVDGAVVGTSQFRPAEVLPDAMEIGFTYIARSEWGSDTNREGKRLMLAHALAHVERCLFRVGRDNRRSRIAVERIGGRLTDIIEPIAFPDGRIVEHVIYVIDRAGFANGPLAGKR